MSRLNKENIKAMNSPIGKYIKWRTKLFNFFDLKIKRKGTKGNTMIFKGIGPAVIAEYHKSSFPYTS